MNKFIYTLIFGFLFTVTYNSLAVWPFTSGTSQPETKTDTSKYKSPVTQQIIQKREAQKAAQASKPTTGTSATKQPTRTGTAKPSRPTSESKPTLADRTITMTNKTKKVLEIKSGTRKYTIEPGQTKRFDFESIQKAGVGYQGSIAPYRPLDLAGIALNLMRQDAANVNVDLEPGTVWSAKITNAKYGSPIKGAVTA